MRSYGKIAKIGVAWGLLSRAMNEVISVPSAMILARLLSPSDFGIAAAASFFIQIAGRLTNFGFNTALVQLKELREEHASSVFFVNMGLGVLMWGLLTISATAMGHLFGSPEVASVIPVAGLAFIIGATGAVPAALLTRDMRFRQSVLSDWIFTGTLSGTSLLFAWYGYSFWSLVYAQLIATCAQNIARYYFITWRPRLAFSRAALREVLGFGLGLHFKRLLDSAALNIDNFIVGSTIGIVGLGLYDKAFTSMSRAVAALTTVGPSVSFRILSIIHEDHERFRVAYRRLLLTATLISYPVLTWLVIAGPELFDVTFGPRWSAAVVPFQLLCVAGMSKVLIAYASSAIQSKGRVWGEVWRQLLYLALIITGVWVGSAWGLVGAAAGVVAATAVMSLLMHTLLLNVASMEWWRDVLAPQVPAVACSVGVGVVLTVGPALVRSAVGVELAASWQLLAVRAGLGAGMYLLFLCFARFSDVRILVRETLSEFVPSHARWLQFLVR